MKKLLLVSSIVGTLGIAGVAGTTAVNAASDSNGNHTSLVQEIAQKFGLDQTAVQQVVDQHRSEHEASIQANQKAMLDQAVKDGKLTQSQEDYIVKAQADIQALLGTSKPKQLSQAVKDQIKQKREALVAWAKANNVDQKYIMMGGMFRGMHTRQSQTSSSSRAPADNQTSTDATDSTSQLD